MAERRVETHWEIENDAGRRFSRWYEDAEPNFLGVFPAAKFAEKQLALDAMTHMEGYNVRLVEIREEWL